MYVPFARKYRPQQFNEVIGQAHIIRTLCNAIEHKQFAYAYLFHGPRGTGKTTIARLFAKALNCMRGITVQPCDECKNCKDITFGYAVDVLEIDGASNRGIDEIRQLREYVKSAPLMSKYKIYIIDEVHMLTEAAFNALLKTLEQPPQHVIFIFATTALHKVPLTIISRCQRFDLHKISKLNMVSYLEKLCQRERIDVGEGVLEQIAQLSEGSVRDAVVLLEQLSIFADTNKITQAHIERLLGKAPYSCCKELLSLLMRGDTHGALDLLEDLIYRGTDLGQLVKDLVYVICDLLYCDTKDFDKHKLLELADELLRVNERMSHLPQSAKILWELLIFRCGLKDLPKVSSSKTIPENKEILYSPLIENILQKCTYRHSDSTTIEVDTSKLNSFERDYIAKNISLVESIVTAKFGGSSIKICSVQQHGHNNLKEQAIANVLEVLGGELVKF